MYDFFMYLAVPLLLLGGILIIFNTLIKQDTKNTKNKFENYIALNRKADFSRTKPIENSRFIDININNFPIMEEKQNFTDAEKKAFKLQNDFLVCASKKMGHFKENNLELKQMYGIANLESIIQYEDNFSSFMSVSFNWAKALSDADMKNEAIQVLEEILKLGLDTSKPIILLADLYKEKNIINKLEQLYNMTKASDDVSLKLANSHIKTLL